MIWVVFARTTYEIQLLSNVLDNYTLGLSCHEWVASGNDEWVNPVTFHFSLFTFHLLLITYYLLLVLPLGQRINRSFYWLLSYVIGRTQTME